jgi:pullulanase/glycogen debranching enzyme
MLGNAGNAAKLEPYWKGNSQGKSFQSLNYIESHDDATLADIIKIMFGDYEYESTVNNKKVINRIKDIDRYVTLSSRLLNASKTGATALFLCQGPIMIHLGQEWGRSKITPDLGGNPPEITWKGIIGSGSDNLVYLTPSPNSYNADNTTNYINYNQVYLNQDLWNYYKGLIELRNSRPLFRNAKPEEITVLKEPDNPNALGVNIAGKIFGFVNSDPINPGVFQIPQGNYQIYADKKTAGSKPLRTVPGGEIRIDPMSQMILILSGE